MDSAVPKTVDLAAEYEASGVAEVLRELDEELIGLEPVKRRIRETAALLLVDRARRDMGLSQETPTLHMSFTGNPGTGKTTVALKMAGLLHRLGYVRKGHLVSVTRDDLVGQYIGHTAPKTKEVLKKAMGGVLFIDEAYYLYRPDNERDYGQEAIEILLQVKKTTAMIWWSSWPAMPTGWTSSFPQTPVSGRASPITSSFPITVTRNCCGFRSGCWKSRTTC